MSYKLKYRTSDFPPGGWSFTDPKTGMKLGDGDFKDVVAAIIKHRQANPKLYPKDNLESFDFATVANQLDAATCARLKNSSRWCESGEPLPVIVDGLLLMIMPNKCPKCGCVEGYEIICKSCSGRRRTGFYCRD